MPNPRGFFASARAAAWAGFPAILRGLPTGSASAADDGKGRATDDEHSLIQHALVLRRVERGQKVARFYALMVERDLFGETVVIRHWGWIGTRGRERMDAHPDETAAAGALAKLAALKRRGYRDL